MKKITTFLVCVCLLCLVACQTNNLPNLYPPIDRSRTPADQQLAYEEYQKNKYIVRDVSDLFDYEYATVVYSLDEQGENVYCIGIDYDVYPKTEMELRGLHTVIKLDARILDYIFTTMIERDVAPDRDLQLDWKPYEEGCFFGFGGAWIFSCLSPEELEEMDRDLYLLSDILKNITITTLWDGGSETVTLSYQKEMEFVLQATPSIQ